MHISLHLLGFILMAKTWHSQPETDQIQAGFAQYHDPVHLWKNTNDWQQAGCILPELGPMIIAHQLASRPDIFGQNLTWPSRLDPGQFCTIWSRLSLEEWNQTVCTNWGSRIQHLWFSPILAACCPVAITGCKYCNQNAEVWRYDSEAWHRRAYLVCKVEIRVQDYACRHVLLIMYIVCLWENVPLLLTHLAPDRSSPPALFPYCETPDRPVAAG